jgi:hypothetical protein
MNERIRQLAQQSELWDRLDPMALGICDGSTENVWGEELQEFAELIVRRCIDLCDGNHEHKNHTDTLFGKGVSTGIQLSQDMIKQHFGVEE